MTKFSRTGTSKLSPEAASSLIGPLMLDVAGLSLSETEKKSLISPVVGGLILFSRNYDNPDQLRNLIAEVRSLSPNIIIAVDHEGGRVQRFKDGFTRIPPMATLNTLYRTDRDQALERAFELGWVLASELGSFDIDISFTPVLDRDCGISEVIGDRAFSGDPDVIIDLSSSLIKGMREAGMASTGKHFPGHGAVAADSHVDIPVDNRAYERIKREDMLVFESVIDNGLDAIMPAHVIYEQVDPSPAGFSRFWMQEVLRKELGFDGVIFSDDLSMEGASVAGDFKARANMALDAGCDMILVCNNPSGAEEVRKHLESLVEKGELDLNNKRLKRMRLHKNKVGSLDSLRASRVWQKYNQI